MDELRYRERSRLVTGLVVIAVGVLFTLDRLGLVQAQQALQWWPVLLVVYGACKLVGLGVRQSITWGAMWLLGGVWQLLYHQGMVTRPVWDLWPVLLIVWGIAMMRGKSGPIVIGMSRRRAWRVRERLREDLAAAARGERGDDAGPGGPHDAGAGFADDPAVAGRAGAGGTGVGDDAPQFTVDAVLSSVTRRITSRALTGGAITSVLGSADVDLRSASLANGVAEIEVNVVMGGAELTIPGDWQVDVRGNPVLSSVEDNSSHTSAPRGRLVLTGALVLSHLVIRN
ncbi:MAG TPA: DUF5668 domain-containing protein [Candidatus Eisenbacteria bacterium]|nr:DUF5668 domain-containing protein [Candidatus Eisenbacteria bacterium]